MTKVKKEHHSLGGKLIAIIKKSPYCLYIILFYNLEISNGPEKFFFLIFHEFDFTSLKLQTCQKQYAFN